MERAEGVGVEGIQPVLADGNADRPAVTLPGKQGGAASTGSVQLGASSSSNQINLGEKQKTPDITGLRLLKTVEIFVAVCEPNLNPD